MCIRDSRQQVQRWNERSDAQNDRTPSKRRDVQMKPTCLSLTLAALLSAAAWSQQPQKPEPIALPERIAPDAPLPGLAPPPEPAKAGEPQPAAATPAQPATPLAKTAPALAKPIEVTTKGNIVMNFQGASLTDV